MISESRRMLMVKIASFSFMVFLFLMPMFPSQGKVSNFFYLSLILMAIVFLADRQRFKVFIQDLKLPLLAVSLFLLYFSLSTLWSDGEGKLSSALKHGIYILFFLLMINHLIKNYGVLTCHSLIFASTFTLLILTFIFVDKSTLLTGRLEHGFFSAPSNVIDLGGYFAIGLISAMIIARESGKHWAYLPASLLFIGLLLTQSRGPLLALIVSSFLLFAQYKHIHLRHILSIAACVVVIGLFFYCTGYGGEYSQRLIDAYQQSYVRFGIWHYAVEVAEQKIWFGWGFDKTLSFTNSLGAVVTTTHSVYLGTLLKGGIVGLVLLAGIIVAGLRCAWRRFHEAMTLEAMLYLFSLMFFITQGMFVIGSPSESWMLFWLPLGIAMAGRRVSQQRQSVRDATAAGSARKQIQR
ncbi:O-antigen ligase family protein [Candidatus Pantoea deserta]|uniref:O-antigen ligase family protein n=1 Tax=Candidatus Pantoea deserta TaxID=1869313 RepID=A0A3N4NY75_9GAMM|nr:O-antigen ligase family protein [Pantoea deserta]RPE00995.1 O-antigen ligase family protein [Pantoea deserta]